MQHLPLNSKPLLLLQPHRNLPLASSLDSFDEGDTEYLDVCVLVVGLPALSSLAEALQQRMDIYKLAADGAKSKGDDRKARMHQRIVKVHAMQLKFLRSPLTLKQLQNNLHGTPCCP